MLELTLIGILFPGLFRFGTVQIRVYHSILTLPN
jgi:hypothetical protein